MKRWGLLLMVLGALSFVLPLLGFQLQIFAIFEEGAGAAALLAIGLGFVLFLVGSAKERLTSAGTEPAPAEEMEVQPEEVPSAGARREAARPEPRASRGERYCSHCGSGVEPTDRFCGVCGGALREPAAREPAAVSAGAAGESTASAAPAKRGGGRVVFFLLVGFAVVYYGYQAISSAEFGSDEFDESALMPDWSQFVVPTDAEIVELGNLLGRADQERSQAQIAGNRELAQRKAQEYQHCQTAMTHALSMRQAIVEMREAEARGDLPDAQSKIHTYQHYQGELSIMLPHVHEPLARLIRPWTEDTW